MEKIILEKVNEVVDKLKADDKLQKEFMKEPVKTLEKILNVDLPDDVIEKIVDAVKAKLTVDDVAQLLGAAKKIFSK